ncbi:MAG TPA: hypothetical protein VMX97_05255 [Hyphomicrobiaceae bacterium]|nr:hypothetical protein [Hyphomicrobiaceae bacterium]
MAAVDAEVPGVRGWNRKVVALGDQPAGTSADAVAAANTETLFYLDDFIYLIRHCSYEPAIRSLLTVANEGVFLRGSHIDEFLCESLRIEE